MREQVVNLFKELPGIFENLSTLLIAFIAAKNTETGKTLFKKQHNLMMSLVLVVVLYFLTLVTGTILQLCYNRHLLPLIICTILILGGAASVLALALISSTVAFITLAIWVGLFALVGFYYRQEVFELIYSAVPKRIKNWTENGNTES